VREHSQHGQRAVAVSRAPRAAFVAVPIEAAAPMPTNDSPTAERMHLHARLPNGVVFDLRELDPRHAHVMIEALGRVRCSVSTKP
jgi:transposase